MAFWASALRTCGPWGGPPGTLRAVGFDFTGSKRAGSGRNALLHPPTTADMIEIENNDRSSAEFTKARPPR